ncbi:MAG: adenylyl-sulfate kinase [Desulfobacterales bacterium]
MARINSGFAVWLTGLPSSGKSVIAQELKRLLSEKGISIQILDSDELRCHLTPYPTFTDKERKWFYEMVAFLAGLLTENGVNVLIAATGSRREYRDNARSGIGRFAEVHIHCPKVVCRERDPKGLWQKAEKGEIHSLPGVGIQYEAPLSPEIKVDSSIMTIKEAAKHIFEGLFQIGFIDPQLRIPVKSA